MFKLILFCALILEVWRPVLLVWLDHDCAVWAETLHLPTSVNNNFTAATQDATSLAAPSHITSHYWNILVSWDKDFYILFIDVLRVPFYESTIRSQMYAPRDHL